MDKHRFDKGIKEKQMVEGQTNEQYAVHKDNTDHVSDHENETSGHHHHVDVEETSGARLLVTLILNLIIPVAQVIGGIFAHSVALISDATHNFSDLAAILIAYFAFRIGKKGASIRNTFGYRRAEVMAALINVVILIAAAVFIVYEAVARFHHPEAVLGRVVIVMAGIGILGNGFSAWLLHRGSEHSLNVRGAFLHMMGDLLTSVAVLVTGIVLLFKPWYWLDPVLSLLIVLFILKNCCSIFKDASGILMNATPKGMDVQKVKDYLENIPGVCGAHYLHAWNVSSSSIAFSCHVEVGNQLVSDTEALAQTIRHELYHRFGIDHPILQFETVQCGNGGVLCEVSGGDIPHT
jgi:cobalt-zinc-cadmium efflux system protein